MADSTRATVTPPSGHRSSMRRTLRTSSPSPTRNNRPHDDLLARLSPASAWEALRAPVGALKACLDHASASEQSFALKTALAAKKIHGWVDELADWPWPAGASSAGFEMPPAKRRKLAGDTETEYLGSLTAQRVAEYEARVDQIQAEMAKLDIEDIKGHVLHTHILPLSRPGTPMTDVSSSLAYTKMEDLTAVVTAVTVQTLPYLAKLTRLTNTWSVRLAVLRKIPRVLACMAEAEVAMKSGWDAIETKESPTTPETAGGSRSKLSKTDFDVMNPVLQQKVVLPGRDLDFMLDALEGMEDTLPDAWLDRMEALERDYADWALTAERRIQEGESSQYYKNQGLRITPQKPKAPHPEIQIQLPSPTTEDIPQSIESPTPFDQSSVASGLTTRRLYNNDPSSMDGQQELDEEESDSSRDISRSIDLDYDGADDERSAADMLADDQTSSSDDEASASPASDASGVHKRYFSSGSGSPKKRAPALAPAPFIARRSISDLSTAFLEAVEEEDEDGRQTELPPNGRLLSRMASQDSLASTVVHDGPVSRSYNDIYREISLEPDFAHLPDPDESLSSDGSQASSPPLRYKTRSASVSFHELPEISTSGLTPPRSPLEPPELFDPESSFDLSNLTHSGSPARKEDSLHRQIRGILRGLPGQIRLTRREASIELNPPDLNLPGSRMKLGEPVRRPGSAMSTMSNMSMASRSTTPSFLLAPAKSSRHRQRNSKDAQMYYLSRSSGEAPMKLLIRTVGENGERVMVRVGGGWADLGEYLKEYAIHHGRRSKGEGKVEVRDSQSLSRYSSSPPSRPGSSVGVPATPLDVRKTRKRSGTDRSGKFPPKTPKMPGGHDATTPDSGASERSASSAQSDDAAENNVLGLSGPKPKKMDMLSEESRAWVEDVTSKVRSVSGDHRPKSAHRNKKDKFSGLGSVGGTKRVFRSGI